MQEIFAQLERAEEILEELQNSADSDASTNEISLKTRNLTQELLAKMRSLLDQTMYSFYEKNIMPSLSNKKREQVKIYFPIVPKKEDLKSRLGLGMMSDLDTKYPKVFSHLDSVQPYNKQYKWMADFNKFANEKHIRLTQQTRVEQKILAFEHKGERVEIGTATVEVGSVGIFLGDKRIHPNQRFSFDSEHIRADPEIRIKKKKSISFVFTGTQIDAIGLCHTVVIEGRSIISQFLSLC